FDHWTAETGLPQNIITAIHQTPEGYLWVATLDGLTRFDGVRFTVFNKSNTPGLSSNRFTCLYQDAHGDPLAGTQVRVVTRYHMRKFIQYKTEQGVPMGIGYGLSGESEVRRRRRLGSKVGEGELDVGRFAERDRPPFCGGPGNVGWKVDGGFWGLDQPSL